MRTLTLTEKQALRLSDPEWYEVVELTNEEAELLIIKMRADDMPAFMRDMKFGVMDSNGNRVHVGKLGKAGSETAARRRRFLEKIRREDELPKPEYLDGGVILEEVRA